MQFVPNKRRRPAVGNTTRRYSFNNNDSKQQPSCYHSCLLRAPCRVIAVSVGLILQSLPTIDRYHRLRQSLREADHFQLCERNIFSFTDSVNITLHPLYD